MPDDPLDDPEVKAWLDSSGDVLYKKIGGSAVVMTMAPMDGKPDPKIALELGYSILLNKPMIAVVLPGSKPPSPKLQRVVDAVIVLDGPIDSPAVAEKVNEAIQEMLSKIDHD